MNETDEKIKKYLKRSLLILKSLEKDINFYNGYSYETVVKVAMMIQIEEINSLKEEQK